MLGGGKVSDAGFPLRKNALKCHPGTLPETNSSPLKMDGWNTTFLLGFGLFSGAFAVSFREGKMSSWYIPDKQKHL